MTEKTIANNQRNCCIRKNRIKKYVLLKEVNIAVEEETIAND